MSEINDLWLFVDDAREVVSIKGRTDWVDLRNLLRVVDALNTENNRLRRNGGLKKFKIIDTIGGEERETGWPTFDNREDAEQYIFDLHMQPGYVVRECR